MATLSDRRLVPSWTYARECYTPPEKMNEIAVELHCMDGNLVVVRGLLIPSRRRTVPIQQLPMTKREVLEHIQTQVNNQLAILALEG